MSVKRQATTELNHENWDQDDPVDPEEEQGGFKIATKDILEKRVIRTAKRRTPATSDEPKKSVFSGFGGFNKAQPTSFDFLSKLTNGNNEKNTSISKAESTLSSSLFSSKPITSTPGPGLFSFQPSSTTTATTKSTFTGTGSLFGASSSNANINSNMFMSSKLDSTTEPFKMQPVTSLGPSTQGITKIPSSIATSDTSEDHKQNEKKMEYYSKLTGLNESVADWIKSHVEQTPLCILSPIFKDYEKYLKEIQDEYQNVVKDSTDSTEDSKGKSFEPKTDQDNKSAAKSSDIQTLSQNTTKKDAPITFSFGNSTTNGSSLTHPAKSMFDNIQEATSKSPSAGSTGFLFGNANTTSPPVSSAPFSFGIGKPFSFSSNVKQSSETTQETSKEDDEDTPPKVEYTPVVEDNSVYDKKCKIFVKKDGNFVDKGVGTLYVKKIEESSKHQLLVRANTNLGTILVNLILVSDIPTQKMGKNNVMMVCIPTPDTKPPPTPILIRVKTSEEADDLLSILNKYKT